MSLKKDYYKSARDEILLRIRQRDNVLGAFLVLTAALVGLVLKNGANDGSVNNLELLLIIPFIGASAAAMLGQHHLLIGRLGKYLNEEFQSLLDDNDPKIHWDNSNSRKEKGKFITMMPTISHIIIVNGISIIPIIVNFKYSYELHLLYSSLWYGSLIVFVMAAINLFYCHCQRGDT